MPPLVIHLGSQFGLAACLVAVMNAVAPESPNLLGALLFGWGVFGGNAALIALIAQRLVHRAEVHANPGAKMLSAVFLILKPIWIALGVYIGLVVLHLRAELLVAGALTGLATFALTSYVLGRHIVLSEKS